MALTDEEGSFPASPKAVVVNRRQIERLPSPRPDPPVGCIDPSCDVYSFGALLVTLITKSATTAEYISCSVIPLKSFIQEVFGTDDFSLLSYTQQQVQTCFGADEDYNSHSGTCIMELAMQCVHKDPTQRPPICEVVNRLQACF